MLILKSLYIPLVIHSSVGSRGMVLELGISLLALLLKSCVALVIPCSSLELYFLYLFSHQVFTEMLLHTYVHIHTHIILTENSVSGTPGT